MLKEYNKIGHLCIYKYVLAIGCIGLAIVMIIRMFYGTELTDEAYYVSDALAMLHGNIPYAYNNYSYGTGSAFLLIPIIFIYQLIVPSNEGIVLFTRICYMLFWYMILIFAYQILKKDFKKSSALLVTGFMIPYAGGGIMFNFSYNTVPCALSYISGLMIYDAVEHKSKYSAIKLICAGFMMGIALFAQPGYAVSIVIFAAVILLRSKEINEKIRNLFFCILGGVIEILLVIIPIIIRTSFEKLVAGIRYKLNPYPTGAMSEVVSCEKLSAILGVYKNCILVVLIVFLAVLFFSLRYIKKNKQMMKEYVLFSAGCAIFILTGIYWCIQMCTDTNNVNWQWGLAGSIGIAVLILSKEFIRYPIILYMGVYPIIFALAEIICVDSSMVAERYVAAVPAMAIYLLIMLNRKSRFVRIIMTVSILACTISMSVNAFRYIYRDEDFLKLDYKVESGVYKGIYTTKSRAHDLPELEEYLNDIIEDGEYYAFRDNVPAGYLMMHKGIMCDKATWDCLNYSYKKNAPAPMYEYYQRRGAFPQKYIYIDYGRDGNLSIEDEGYLFNEFIDAYYTKIADFALNSTFYHVVVYEYSGEFDGNFEPWIERHMYTEELKGGL